MVLAVISLVQAFRNELVFECVEERRVVKNPVPVRLVSAPLKESGEPRFAAGRNHTFMRPLLMTASRQVRVTKNESTFSRDLKTGPLGLDRETVIRVLSQEENQLLVQGYRDAVLKIVPNALIGASELVKTRGNAR